MYDAKRMLDNFITVHQTSIFDVIVQLIIAKDGKSTNRSVHGYVETIGKSIYRWVGNAINDKWDSNITDGSL
jgi:hypothetical protein